MTTRRPVGEVEAHPEKLRGIRARELAIRFGFGASIAVVAAAATMRFGPRVGGLFLAFPAILPASLTLIERTDGGSHARHDAHGAAFGSLGMMAFALTVLLMATKAAPPLALAAATGSWLMASVGAFLLFHGVPKGRPGSPTRMADKSAAPR